MTEERGERMRQTQGDRVEERGEDMKDSEERRGGEEKERERERDRGEERVEERKETEGRRPMRGKERERALEAAVTANTQKRVLVVIHAKHIIHLPLAVLSKP